jgi:hypothetical protein
VREFEMANNLQAQLKKVMGEAEAVKASAEAKGGWTPEDTKAFTAKIEEGNGIKAMIEKDAALCVFFQVQARADAFVFGFDKYGGLIEHAQGASRMFLKQTCVVLGLCFRAVVCGGPIQGFVDVKGDPQAANEQKADAECGPAGIHALPYMSE